MFITKKGLSRRTVLRAAGACVALPPLDAMMPALSAQASTAQPKPRQGTVKRFAINVSDAVLADLGARLAHTRWPPDMENDDWRYGAPRAYLEELVEYWRSKYDWRAQERRMNSYAHFITSVDDIPIHFIHERGKGPDPIPLIMTHGWPDSFWDFEKVIRPLTDPASFGGHASDSFDVIVPSLPGFGFSVPLQVTGINVERTADLWVKLMKELGYERFAAQGLSWGQLVTARLGHQYPQHLIGLHMSGALSRGMMGERPANDDEYAADEMKLLARTREAATEHAGHGGVHTTEPQTVAYAMHDSPVGLLAWVMNGRYWWSDHGGRIETRFSKDDLITNAMLSWVNESFVTSARYYWESRHHPWKPAHAGMPQVAVPTAVQIAPGEVNYQPRRWLEKYYNLQQLTFMKSGGHFAAMEEPEAVVADIQTFFRGLRQAKSR